MTPQVPVLSPFIAPDKLVQTTDHVLIIFIGVATELSNNVWKLKLLVSDNPNVSNEIATPEALDVTAPVNHDVHTSDHDTYSMPNGANPSSNTTSYASAELTQA